MKLLYYIFSLGFFLFAGSMYGQSRPKTLGDIGPNSPENIIPQGGGTVAHCSSTSGYNNLCSNCQFMISNSCSNQNLSAQDLSNCQSLCKEFFGIYQCNAGTGTASLASLCEGLQGAQIKK